MKKGDGSIDWTFSELLVFKCNSHVFTIKSERESARVHVETDAKDSLLLELLAKLRTFRIGVMSELTQTIIGPPKLIV